MMPPLFLPTLFILVGIPALVFDLRTREIPLYLSLGAVILGVANAFAVGHWVLGAVLVFLFIVCNIPIPNKRYRPVQLVACGCALPLAATTPTAMVGLLLGVVAAILWLTDCWGGADTLFALGLAGLFPSLAFLMLFFVFWVVFVVLWFIAVRYKPLLAAIGYLLVGNWAALRQTVDTPNVHYPMLVPLIASAIVYVSLQIL